MTRLRPALLTLSVVLAVAPRAQQTPEADSVAHAEVILHLTEARGAPSVSPELAEVASLDPSAVASPSADTPESGPDSLDAVLTWMLPSRLRTGVTASAPAASLAEDAFGAEGAWRGHPDLSASSVVWAALGGQRPGDMDAPFGGDGAAEGRFALGPHATDAVRLSLDVDGAERLGTLTLDPWVAPRDTVLSPLDTLRMSRWERVWWGRRGVMRRVGLFPTHPDNPVDDLRQVANVRRRMLSWHQTAGLVTVASMAATVVGGQLAVNGQGSGFHKATLPITIGLYSGTAALALLSPPKPVDLGRRGGGIDSITMHRWLAVGHVAGMILTPLLAPDGADDATVHQVTGYATFATFSAAMLVVTLLRR